MIFLSRSIIFLPLSVSFTFYFFLFFLRLIFQIFQPYGILFFATNLLAHSNSPNVKDKSTNILRAHVCLYTYDMLVFRQLNSLPLTCDSLSSYREEVPIALQSENKYGKLARLTMKRIKDRVQSEHSMEQILKDMPKKIAFGAPRTPLKFGKHNFYPNLFCN